MTRCTTCCPAEQIQRRIDEGVIEVAPLAFMRGRTLAHSYVILDEAQNCTPQQMKMFLTRLGEGARMAVTGDPTQTDLPSGASVGVGRCARRAGRRRRRRDHSNSPKKTSSAIRWCSASCGPMRRAMRARGSGSKRPVDGPIRLDSCEVRVEAPAWRKAWPNARARTVRQFLSQAATAARVVPVPATARSPSCWPTMRGCAALNAQFRGKDRPTNVLSFPDPAAPLGRDGACLRNGSAEACAAG